MKILQKHWFKAGVVLSIALLVIIFSVSRHVKQIGSSRIVEAQNVEEADAILILGARVYSNGNVSLMLKDRLTVGLELYEKRKSHKIIVSGDHGTKAYDEVNTMKRFLLEEGVPGKDVFMDHAGFSTYESIYRARDIFKVKKLIIVTQEYHLMRALFIAEQLGLQAYGVPSDKHIYNGVMFKSEIREIAARNKDYVLAKYIRPQPTYLGEIIPVTGDGRQTDDKLNGK